MVRTQLVSWIKLVKFHTDLSLEPSIFSCNTFHFFINLFPNSWHGEKESRSNLFQCLNKRAWKCSWFCEVHMCSTQDVSDHVNDLCSDMRKRQITHKSIIASRDKSIFLNSSFACPSVIIMWQHYSLWHTSSSY